MKKVGIVVGFVTLFAILFQISPFIGIPEQLIFFMFFISPFPVIYMVYVILKYGKPSGNTFEERFYEDYDYKRNGKEG